MWMKSLLLEDYLDVDGYLFIYLFIIVIVIIIISVFILYICGLYVIIEILRK
jgi:hypothetical protein